MKITLDGNPRYTSQEDVQNLKSNAPDHEVWFRATRDDRPDEFFYLRVSPRIPKDEVENIIWKITKDPRD
jgi:hypothetical protein